jgi:hypothetical protein
MWHAGNSVVGRSPLLRSYIRLDRTRFVTSRTIRLTPDSDIDQPIAYRPFALDIDPRTHNPVVLNRPLSYVLAPRSLVRIPFLFLTAHHRSTSISISLVICYVTLSDSDRVREHIPVEPRLYFLRLASLR